MADDHPESWPSDLPLAGARLLLISPHPDDESLAMGGLIQHAVRQGAVVTLVQITDGDNNPWPQRWLERRWRIGPRERLRWGERRTDEVRAAISQLGLPVMALQRLGWPDLGVWSRLRDDDPRAVGVFANLLRSVQPDVVVMPDLADRHPDHGASHVLMRLAMAQQGRLPACLTYLVHGQPGGGGQPVTVTLDAAEQAAKRQAALAHQTQMALSRRRLMRLVGPVEHFQRAPATCASTSSLPAVVALPWRPPRVLARWLQLTLVHAGGLQTWRWRDAPLQPDGKSWQLTLPADVRRGPVFAKLELRCPSPWIFDHWDWCDLTVPVRASQAVA
ncbi:MAG TPA: PIG-L family deacetylase [Rhodanobacteraceae bacterium]